MYDLDPVHRYKSLLGAVAMPPAALSPDALRTIIEATQPDDPTQMTAALARHVAVHSRLTVNDASQLVSRALPAQGDAGATAEAVSSAVTSAISADVELSDPVMLWPEFRAAVALLLFLAFAASILLTYRLADHSANGAPVAAYAALAIAASSSLVGVLVLVMGYKTVKIKGGTGSD